MKSKILVVFLLLAIFLSGCSWGVDPPIETETPEPEIEYEVEYEIWGTANSVNITLSNSTGGTEQYGNVILPKTFSYIKFSADFLYISAQNTGSSGTVNVRCYLYDNLKDSAHSEGAYVIATASYYRPLYW